VSEQFAVRRQAVNALTRRTAVALARALVGDLAEKLSFGVFAPALIPIIGSDRYIRFPREFDDLIVGKSERTARDSVVSGTAQRVTVHFPKEDRLTLLGS